MWINDYDDYQVTTAFTSAKNAAERPELVKKFIAAYAKGAADFNAVMVDKTKGDAAVEEMTKLIHKYVYTSRPYEKAAPSIKNGAMRLQPGLKLNLSSVKKQLAWFQSEGLVEAGITINTLVDPKFVKPTDPCARLRAGRRRTQRAAMRLDSERLNHRHGDMPV